MRDRTETAVVSLTLFTATAALALSSLLPSADFQRLGIFYAGQACFALMWFYTIFWAFSLRRLLSVKRFRNQALGLGLVAVGWATFDYSFLITSEVLPDVAIFLALLLTFYWLDASILAGRKSDPLYRNTLHWTQLRAVLWPLLVVATVVEGVGLLVEPSAFSIIIYGGVSANPLPLAFYLVSLTYLVVFAPGSVYLLASAYRSKDRTFRVHLGWFGLFAASFLVFLPVGVLTNTNVLLGLAYLLGTYALYRSAKALAPINRLPLMSSP